MSGNDEEEYNIINGEIPAPKPKESYYKHKKKGTNLLIKNQETVFNANI